MAKTESKKKAKFYKQTPSVCASSWCTIFAFFIVFSSFIFACIEIELEGRDGWAIDLPTPNIGKHFQYLTLYHVFMFIFIFSMFNLAFVFNPKFFTWRNELFVLSLMCMWFLFEDVFWFVLNPYYGFKHIGDAWWHATWQDVPIIYAILPLISMVLAGISGYAYTYLKSLFFLALGFGIVLAISPLYQLAYKASHNEIIATIDKTPVPDLK